MDRKPLQVSLLWPILIDQTIPSGRNTFQRGDEQIVHI